MPHFGERLHVYHLEALYREEKSPLLIKLTVILNAAKDLKCCQVKISEVLLLNECYN